MSADGKHFPIIAPIAMAFYLGRKTEGPASLLWSRSADGTSGLVSSRSCPRIPSAAASAFLTASSNINFRSDV
jgi:hypothetical protein